MTNIAVIENKVSSVKKYLKILGRYKKYSKQELESDVDIRGALERYLYLAAQAIIDLSEAVVAFKEFRKPNAMSESFYILEEEGVVPAKLAEKLAGMAGFRNVIAHDYEKINYDIVYEVLHKGLGDIEKFLAAIKKSFRL